VHKIVAPKQTFQTPSSPVDDGVHPWYDGVHPWSVYGRRETTEPGFRFAVWIFDLHEIPWGNCEGCGVKKRCLEECARTMPRQLTEHDSFEIGNRCRCK